MRKKMKCKGERERDIAVGKPKRDKKESECEERINTMKEER